MMGCGPRRRHRDTGQEWGWRIRDDLPLRSRLYRRPRPQQKIAGVCGGIADYFGISAKWVRLIFLIGFFFAPVPVLIFYVILGFVLRVRPDDLYESPQEEAFWQSVRRDPPRTVHSLKAKFRDLERRLRSAEAAVTSPGFKMDQELKR